MAGWTLPLVSVARVVMVCSPGMAFGQDRDQNFQVNSDPAPSVMAAGIHRPSSTWTSTLAIGRPQAAPTILMAAVHATHPSRRRFEQGLAHQRLGPDRLPVTLLFTNRHVVTRHEVSREARIDD